MDNRKGIQPTRNLCQLSSKVLFQNKWRKKTEREPANPGLTGKQPKKWRQWCY